jgi:hypothetical protein
VGNLGKDGADNFSTGCPPSELATGIHGHAGEFLDAIGLICGPPPSNRIPPATSVNPLAMKPVGPATKVNPLATAPATAATAANPLVKAPVPTPDMFTIVTPVNNDRVQLGQLVVKATPPKIGAGSVTVLQLTWLDAPPRQPPSYTIAVETPKLLQGYLIPQHDQPKTAGRWEVQARIAAQPTPGPLSFPVQFQVVGTQPFQSQKQSSPIQQTAPLPSSSVTQPSPIQQTAPLPPPAVMQAPAPSSATTQMNRSSSMFRSRGVEEKGGTDSNQTVDQPAEMDKKP